MLDRTKASPELTAKSMVRVSVNSITRVTKLLAPYDVVVTTPDGLRFEFGRFSAHLMQYIHVVQGTRSPAPALKVGAFCEIGVGSRILIGGEHRNDSLWNNTFAVLPEMAALVAEEDRDLVRCEPHEPIEIGDNVLISQSVRILGGVKIDNGAVIGANALVCSDCEECGVYAGVPARLLRYRFDPVRTELYRRIDYANIRTHELPRVPKLLSQISSAEQFREQIDLMPHRPLIELEGQPEARDYMKITRVTGCSVAGRPVSHPKVDEYFGQMFSTGDTIRWSPDIFHALGLS